MKNYIKYLKYRYDLKKARGFKKPKTDEEFEEYFFGDKVNAVYKKYNHEKMIKPVIKKDKVVKSVAGLSLATLGLVGFLVAGNIINNSNDKSIIDTQETSATTIETTTERDYGYILSQDEVLELASVALRNIEENLISNGASSMGEVGTPFYPKWFNPQMIATIAFMESSYRATNNDGTPLLGKEVVNDRGEKERARGMCQILPSSLNQINNWLKNTMESDLSYTIEDCDNPEKALEICILINIMNCKNYFDSNEDIYIDPNYNFKDNIDLQGQCVVASYKYGCGNIHKAYLNNTLYDTYLNKDWNDREGTNYLRRFNEIYNSMQNEIGE